MSASALLAVLSDVLAFKIAVLAFPRAVASAAESPALLILPFSVVVIAVSVSVEPPATLAAIPFRYVVNVPRAVVFSIARAAATALPAKKPLIIIPVISLVATDPFVK